MSIERLRKSLLESSGSKYEIFIVGEPDGEDDFEVGKRLYGKLVMKVVKDGKLLLKLEVDGFLDRFVKQYEMSEEEEWHVKAFVGGKLVNEDTIGYPEGVEFMKVINPIKEIDDNDKEAIKELLFKVRLDTVVQGSVFDKVKKSKTIVK